MPSNATISLEDNVCAHYARKFSLRDLGCLFDISHMQAWRILKSRGVKLRPVGRPSMTASKHGKTGSKS